ncbi:Outer membrane protein [Croceitalea dokdonensis DOKDO 023]|uniref:Outer membrane protein n=1 Tax=Croceitalea dokdonensis DOKDO 023 TaxID=1300341 RepID=A0A0P7AWK4_9FLAO|nr:AsmA-like C-terminal region-containing protein [Croceitalea dokdonensis]KPM32477.1 Outer membrane protein [Croceitalea dokdonensis DOKDO 023]
MKKRLLKIALGFFAFLLLLVIAVPFFLEGKIADIIKNKVNQNINATFDFEQAKLSLIKSFPDAYLDLQGVSLVNKVPFEGDTLFAAKDIALELSVKELFKRQEDPIAIKKLTLDGALLHIQVDSLENVNYDIALPSKTDTQQTDSGSSSDFKLDLRQYAVTGTKIIYDDYATGMHLEISDMNHVGTGDLSLANSQLQTKTDALVSFAFDGTNYLDNNAVALDALLGIDLEQSKFSFLENKALVNQLPLVFDGFVKLNDENQEVDINFNTPSSDFKNFLAVIPEGYSKNIENVTTTGNFEVSGFFKGLVDDTHIPTFGISINSENASFKYPDLPKAVTNIFLKTEIKNTTGITEDTFVDIDRLSFKIDDDRFNLNAKIHELLGNTKVKAHADGKINLANISKAYPVSNDFNLKGILATDLTTAFDMASVENQQYKNTTTNGTFKLADFQYKSEELKHPVTIDEAVMTFNPTTVSLNSFSGKMGQTDFKATGTLINLLGFVFNDEKLEGNFNLASDTFAVGDFMVEEPAEPDGGAISGDTKLAERIKIPSFLDCTIQARAANVLYDNLNLKNVVGTLLIKEEIATLKDVQAGLFGGTIGMDGAVATKGEVSNFEMNLDISNFQIAESFKALDLFKILAPVANALEGKLNSNITLSGVLKDDMTPNLATLSGSLMGELLSAQVNTKEASVLKALNNSVTFIDLDALDLKDLKTALTFNDGRVAVKPFKLTYKDITINISGNHTFDKALEYQAVLDVPAAYLGNEVNSIIAKLDDDSLNGLTIPVTASITGAYNSPNVTTDLKSGVTNLTKRLVEIQKQKMVNQGKDKAKDLLGGLLGNNKDATTSDSTKTKAVQMLGGLLGAQKKDSVTIDSSGQRNQVKDAAKSVLGNLLGRKKKQDSTQN